MRPAALFDVDRTLVSVDTARLYGPGKVTRASNWALTHGIDSARSSFYKDSISDLPMLEAVGVPRVVNPDPRLRLVAARRRYPVESWK